MKTKRCSKCHKRFTIDNYYTIVNKQSGKIYLLGCCKDCSKKQAKQWTLQNSEKHRFYQLKTKYNITAITYNNLLIKQNGRCAICGTNNPGRYPNFCLDHNHKTGKIRGLLCQNCNKAVGLLQDNHKHCEKAAKYLRGK